MNKLNIEDIRENTDVGIDYPFLFLYSSDTLDFFSLFGYFVFKSIYEDDIDMTYEQTTETHFLAFKSYDDAKLYIEKINVILDLLKDPATEITFNVTEEKLEKHKEFFTICDEE